MSHRHNGDRLLTPNTRESSGRINLYDGKTSRSMSVVQAMMLAFVGPKPADHAIIYRDGNTANLRLDNLRYTLLPEIEHAPHGAGALAMARSGLTVDQARAIAASPDKAADVARDYGISISTVYRIRQGRLWAAETVDVRRSSYQRLPATVVLTEADVTAILASPERNVELAERYGIAKSAISSLRTSRRDRLAPSRRVSASNRSRSIVEPLRLMTILAVPSAKPRHLRARTHGIGVLLVEV